MRLSLRSRIVLTALPQLVLLAILGGTAAILIYRLGESIEVILRENYDSVRYMQNLKEALERIDSSFLSALADHEDLAQEQYSDEQWKTFRDNIENEHKNITIHPQEDQLFRQLDDLSKPYRDAGDAFYRLPKGDPKRHVAYFGPAGLRKTFNEIKSTADAILVLNQGHMESAGMSARETARNSLIDFVAALLTAGAIGVLLVWRTVTVIVRPIRLVTQSTRAIGTGNLDQVVPVAYHDELGDLAESFNIMARQLRQYRQTDYSRLLRAQRTGQATIDSFPHPVLVIDPEGLVELANPEAQRLLGVTGKRPETTALPWQPPEVLREPLRLALKEHIAYSPEQFDRVIVMREAGQEKSFLPRITPIRDPYGYTLGAAVLLEDVTRFRLLDQIKGNLVATASHELKTPLASIRLAHHVLLEEKVGSLNAKQSELLIDARENTERLLDMVNHLLDLARLEKGREHLDYQLEMPETLLRAAAESIRPRAQDKGIAIALELPPSLPHVSVDSHRMGHALGNLLDNALTYTDAGGCITLSASVLGDRVILSVADTGIGIPPDQCSRVFERFSRIPGQSRGEGTGLGLAIVHEIVTAHDGTVTCESKPGAGSVFRIELPARKGMKDEG